MWMVGLISLIRKKNRLLTFSSFFSFSFFFFFFFSLSPLFLSIYFFFHFSGHLRTVFLHIFMFVRSTSSISDLQISKKKKRHTVCGKKKGPRYATNTCEGNWGLSWVLTSFIATVIYIYIKKKSYETRHASVRLFSNDRQPRPSSILVTLS